MKASMKAAAVILAVVTGLGSTLPARAGELSWTDPAGDATTLGQGSWDITKVGLSFDGTTFVAKIKVVALGDPPPFGTGQNFAVRWNFGDGQFTMRLTHDRFTGEKYTFQARAGESQVSTLTCKTCKHKLDRAKSEITMQIGFETLKSAMRKLAPGQKIESITAFASNAHSEPSGTFGTLLWGTGTPGDTAPPPAGTTFTF
jgi:hypothetical protein